MKKLLSFLALAGALAFGQGTRYDNFTWSVSAYTPGVSSPLISVPGAKLNLCNSPANAVPCTNYATTYTDETLTVACPDATQVVLAGTTTCVANSDSYGNFGFNLTPGVCYQYTVTYNGASSGPYPLCASLVNGGSASFKNTNNIPHCEKYGTPGITHFQTLMAACVAALPSTGPGIVDATNITDATNLIMTGNWTMNRSGTTVLFGQYTVTMGANQISVPSPTSNVKFIGSTAYAGTPSTCANGTCFRNTNSVSAAALVFGDTSATSFGFVVEDIYLDLTGSTNGIGLDFVRVYGGEINRLRGAASVAANTATFILLNGTSTAPGGQSITIRNPVENNFQFGIISSGGVSPPLCNNTQYIGGQFSGNSNSGSIAIDIQCGNDHEFFGPYISGYDTGLKVAAASSAAVFGKLHIESCGTQGILMTAAANNNDIWSDTGCAITDNGGQNNFHDPNYLTGRNYIYGSLRTLGTSALNVFDAGLEIKGGTAGLPAATTGGQGFICIGSPGTPNVGKCYVGDGTGWQITFAKRTGSSDTDLFILKDNGVMQFTGITFSALGTTANGSIVYCSDCAVANPCAGSGTGAFAKRLNDAWVCN